MKYKQSFQSTIFYFILIFLTTIKLNTANDEL